MVGDLLLGKESTYKVVVKNRSQQRPYAGPIEVRVETSFGAGVLTSSLPSINNLQQDHQLDQGRLLVDRESDAFSYLTFSAVLVKGGVVLGQVQQTGKKLVQVQYLEKENAPVLLGNAKSDAQTMLDIVADQGGIERVSILDLALPGQSSLLSNGRLSGKVVLLAQREVDQQMGQALNRVIRSPQSLFIVASSRHGDQHYASLLSLDAMKSFVRQTVTIAGHQAQELAFANQYSPSSHNKTGVVVVKSDDLPNVQPTRLAVG